MNNLSKFPHKEDIYFEIKYKKDNMKITKNKFGESKLYNKEDLQGTVFCVCCACMSVYSDFLSWANKYPDKICMNPEKADNIIVLGCQVTDLAVLNDIQIARDLHNKYKKDIFIGGCLAQRFDIQLDNYMKRIDVLREVGVGIEDKSLISYAKPFWLKEFDENSKDDLSQGMLFRNMYPLKIGAGCKNKCKYCTIRFTRGDCYEEKAYLQIEEFISHENVVIVSDNPTYDQIVDWCNIASDYNKEISFRNVEPTTARSAFDSLLDLSQKGLLKILHCPIQSCNDSIIKYMGRNIEDTKDFIKKAQLLRANDTFLATNIIIDYKIGDKIYHNLDKDFMDNNFDYWVWNPYWDGVWDEDKAKERFNKYILE